MCNVEGPPPEPWVPMRPFSERVVGRPSRCTLPFLGTVRSFCHVPENVDFRLPLEGERADKPPEGFFTLYEEHLMRARLWFPIPSVIVEFLNRLEVSIMHNPIPPFPEDLCVVRNLLRGGPLFWGHFSPARVRAAVEAHRSRFSSSIDDDMGVFFEDTSLPAVYATRQSSRQRPTEIEDDAEPTVEDPIFGG
ncbi:unnamed protein product [Brassica rapa]|uniref:Uncharacterized protein n=1 Tax=Brassica campestris TaxID=3711 RepID=A0A8D9CY27_BRACM|nr:unnamed protein product [Brassica rapa]